MGLESISKKPNRLNNIIIFPETESTLEHKSITNLLITPFMSHKNKVAGGSSTYFIGLDGILINTKTKWTMDIYIIRHHFQLLRLVKKLII